MTRASDPQISFADLEFLNQGVRLEPLLRAISQFIDEHAELVEMVRRDLVRGLKRPDTGRNGLTAQEALRSLTLMRVKNWDYRELRERIADGYTLRHFTHFNSKCPASTILRGRVASQKDVTATVIVSRPTPNYWFAAVSAAMAVERAVSAWIFSTMRRMLFFDGR